MATNGDPALESCFPKLTVGGYRITSPRSKRYNCIAWAAGHDHEWWDNTSNPGTKWPAGIPDDGHIESLAKVFASLGYIECDTGDQEVGFEKVALYADQNRQWKHAARQLKNGRWSSKCGKGYDIEHFSVDGVECPLYGSIAKFMKRPVPKTGILAWVSTRISRMLVRFLGFA